jgi:TonB family protein
VKGLVASLSGAAATAALTLLLAALVPRADGLPATRPEPVRPILRAPAPEPEAPRAPLPKTPARAARGSRAPGAPAGGAGREPGRAASPAAGGPPDANLRAILAPILAAPGVRTGGVAWPEARGWPADSLSGFALPGGGEIASGGTGGLGTGAGAGSGRGTGRGAASPAPAVRRGPTRRAIAEYAPQPVYPAGMRSREESGFVEALVRVDASGAVTSVEVVSSSGGAALEDAVRGAVARWRFSPALRDGTPVATTLRRRFEFRMVDR